MKNIRTKRVYETPDPDDGCRVLVDRVWPRGLSKEKVRADEWLKEAAPSGELRRWFGHDPQKWPEFRRRYGEELDDQPDAVARLLRYAEAGTLTLLYSARDRDHNQAVALRDYLLGRR
jgi:uncharacterized protein YeaO (DUF488 family)